MRTVVLHAMELVFKPSVVVVFLALKFSVLF
jgi:hypothetical protein